VTQPLKRVAHQTLILGAFGIFFPLVSGSGPALSGFCVAIAAAFRLVPPSMERVRVVVNVVVVVVGVGVSVGIDVIDGVVGVDGGLLLNNDHRQSVIAQALVEHLAMIRFLKTFTCVVRMLKTLSF